MDRKLVALNIGSEIISAAIGSQVNGEFELIETIAKPSKGFADNKVVDKKLLTEAILDVLEELSHRFSQRIDSVYISVSSKNLGVIYSKGASLLSQEGAVTERDIFNAYMDGKKTIESNENYIFDSIIRNIYLDGEIVEVSPLGMPALSVETDIDNIFIENVYLNEIKEIFSSIGCKIDGFILGLDSLRKVFSADNKSNTSELCIEFDYDKTDFIYYENNRIREIGSIPLGGVNIIKDLSIVTKIDENIIKIIKEKHCEEYDTLRREFSKINYEDINLDAVLFYDVINARIEEILEYVKRELNSKGLYDSIDKVTVFGDSICLFENINLFIEDILQKKTKVFTKNDVKVENSSIITSIAIVKEVSDRLNLLGKDIINYHIPKEEEKVNDKIDKISSEDVKKEKKKGLSKVLGFLGDIF